LVALKVRKSSTAHHASVLPLSRDADGGLLTFRRSWKACRLELMVLFAASATTVECAARLVEEVGRNCSGGCSCIGESSARAHTARANDLFA
jgi:hypothetical protein